MKIYKQRGNSDCVLACLSMAMKLPYSKLWPKIFRREIEEAKGAYGSTFERAFEIAGLSDYLKVYVTNPEDLQLLFFGRRALLQVPSLNYKGGSHLVYWDGRELHDPSNKKTYKRIEDCKPTIVWIINMS